ncbi:MAG: phosphoglycerate kinase [Desulfurococcales archaeon]|nr:phosphoglycerate kinase [Desulfurococcales archaeon]
MLSQQIPRIPILDDIDVSGKKVFLRVDINVPINPDTGKIADDRRIRVHAKTIKLLVEKYNAAVVIGSHQGRPGEKDFVSLEKHADLLRTYSGVDIEFVEDVMGPTARKAIKELERGRALLLDNLRFVSEELIEAVPEKQANTFLVRRLGPLFDVYVNDAFAAAHRSQPSLVGFPMVLPSVAGPVFYREIDALRRAFEKMESPRIFVLGGVKVHDMVRVIEHLVRSRVADRILTLGLVAQLFLVAKGVGIGIENLRTLEEKGLITLIPRARRILFKGAPIETPIDFATVDDKGNVKDEKVGAITRRIMDIGENTISMYSGFVKDAKVVIMRGSAGVIEDERFRKGTKSLLEAAMDSRAFVLIGGGHLASLVDEESIDKRRVHVSTGGNALLLFLSGETLPALEALAMSAKMFLGW